MRMMLYETELSLVQQALNLADSKAFVVDQRAFIESVSKPVEGRTDVRIFADGSKTRFYPKWGWMLHL